MFVCLSVTTFSNKQKAKTNKQTKQTKTNQVLVGKSLPVCTVSFQRCFALVSQFVTAGSMQMVLALQFLLTHIRQRDSSVYVKYKTQSEKYHLEQVKQSIHPEVISLMFLNCRSVVLFMRDPLMNTLELASVRSQLGQVIASGVGLATTSIAKMVYVVCGVELSMLQHRDASVGFELTESDEEKIQEYVLEGSQWERKGSLHESVGVIMRSVVAVRDFYIGGCKDKQKVIQIRSELENIFEAAFEQGVLRLGCIPFSNPSTSPSALNKSKNLSFFAKQKQTHARFQKRLFQQQTTEVYFFATIAGVYMARIYEMVQRPKMVMGWIGSVTDSLAMWQVNCSDANRLVYRKGQHWHLPPVACEYLVPKKTKNCCVFFCFW